MAADETEPDAVWQPAPQDGIASETTSPGPSGAPRRAGRRRGDQGDADIHDLIARLHRQHALTLVRAANLLLRDRHSAEDVVQEAFLSLYRALPRLRDHDQVLPYLRTTVINRARSALRSRRRAVARSVQHEIPESSAESTVMVKADQRAALTAVGRLPRRAREVLVLRYYLDLSDREIAATLGVSRGTVSSTASRALAALALDLTEEK